MSEIMMSEIENNAYDKLLQSQYMSLAPSVFSTQITQSEDFKMTYNITKSEAYHPGNKAGAQNNIKKRTITLETNEISSLELKETISLLERDYNQMAQKGLSGKIINTVQESITSHQNIHDILAFKSKFFSDVEVMYDPNGLLTNQKVDRTIPLIDWTNANGSDKVNSIMSVIDKSQAVTGKVNMILIGSKAWRNLIAGEVSEQGKLAIIDSIKQQVGIPSGVAMFAPTQLLDDGNNSYIYAYNTSNLNQEYFIHKIPYVSRTLKQDDEDNYFLRTRSIYGGLQIYKQGAIAQGIIKVA